MSPGLTGAAGTGSPPVGIGAAMRRPCGALPPITQIVSTGSEPRSTMSSADRNSACTAKQPRTGIFQEVAKLRAARRRIDGNDHRPEPAAAEKKLDQLLSVGADDGNPIAGADARLRQTPGSPCRDVGRIAKAQGEVVDADQHLAAEFFGLPPQHLGHGALGRRDRDQGRDRFHIVIPFTTPARAPSRIRAAATQRPPAALRGRRPCRPPRSSENPGGFSCRCDLRACFAR